MQRDFDSEIFGKEKGDSFLSSAFLIWALKPYSTQSPVHSSFTPNTVHGWSADYIVTHFWLKIKLAEHKRSLKHIFTVVESLENSNFRPWVNGSLTNRQIFMQKYFEPIEESIITIIKSNNAPINLIGIKMKSSYFGSFTDVTNLSLKDSFIFQYR